jgi:hypothetical protein
MRADTGAILFCVGLFFGCLISDFFNLSRAQIADAYLAGIFIDLLRF